MRKPDVVVQVVVLAEDLHIQALLAEQGVQVRSTYLFLHIYSISTYLHPGGHGGGHQPRGGEARGGAGLALHSPGPQLQARAVRPQQPGHWHPHHQQGVKCISTTINRLLTL